MARVCLLRDGSISICHRFPGTQPAPSGKVPPEKLQHFQARDFGWCWNVGCPVGRMTLDVVRMPNSCCPAAECDTVNQWKCKDSWEIKQVFNNCSLLVTIFFLKVRFLWVKGKVLKLSKVACLRMTMIQVVEWLWLAEIQFRHSGSLCWWCAKAWFFTSKNCLKDPTSQMCLGTIRDELQWCETTLFQIEVAILVWNASSQESS